MIDKYLDDKDYFKTRLETDFQTDIKEVLTNIGVYAIKMPASTEKGAVVLPDLLCLPRLDNKDISKPFFIEVKLPKKNLSPIQKSCFKILNRKYAPVYTVHDWEEVNNLIKQLIV